MASTTKQDELIEQMKLMNEKLDKLISLWLEKEDRQLHPKKAISTGQHSPLTPEEMRYARLGSRNTPETSRL